MATNRPPVQSQSQLAATVNDPLDRTNDGSLASHKIQKSQLQNLQRAGGQPALSQSQIEMGAAIHSEGFEGDGIVQLEQKPEEFDPNLPKNVRKKGQTQKFLTEEEERQYLDYTMLTDLFDFDELKQSEYFAIKKYKESLYRGEIQTRLREGLGICVYENSRIYEGAWKTDKRHGKGYERFSNGNQYLGDYQFGRVCGKGLYTWRNGDTYDGEWVDGIKHGYGVWKGINGDSYIGQWVQNKAHGYGVHEWANGDRYEGEWKHCLRHGQGSDTFANGDMYLGEYSYGKAEGYGQYKWANGNSYSGIFKDGMKEGKGVWKKQGTQDQTNMYEGEYHKDMKHGQGEFRWQSGGYYRGGYENDIKTGYGEMYWADGSIYRGTWQKGVQNGLGIMIFANGTRKAGIFKKNVLIELLVNPHTIKEMETKHGAFSETFKQELKEYIGLMNPNENNAEYLDKKYRDAKVEDKTMPNTLLEMQEISNAPWDPANNSGMTREEYIAFVKGQELEEEKKDTEPVKTRRSNTAEEEARKKAEAEHSLIFQQQQHFNEMQKMKENEELQRQQQEEIQRRQDEAMLRQAQQEGMLRQSQEEAMLRQSQEEAMLRQSQEQEMYQRQQEFERQQQEQMLRQQQQDELQREMQRQQHEFLLQQQQMAMQAELDAMNHPNRPPSETGMPNIGTSHSKYGEPAQDPHLVFNDFEYVGYNEDSSPKQNAGSKHGVKTSSRRRSSVRKKSVGAGSGRMLTQTSNALKSSYQTTPQMKSQGVGSSKFITPQMKSQAAGSSHGYQMKNQGMTTNHRDHQRSFGAGSGKVFKDVTSRGEGSRDILAHHSRGVGSGQIQGDTRSVGAGSGKNNEFRTIAVGANSPRFNKFNKSIGTSPRSARSPASASGKQQRDSHPARHRPSLHPAPMPHKRVSQAVSDSNFKSLPDIVKRGPVKNRKNIVGLSINARPIHQSDNKLRANSRLKVKNKRASIEQSVRSQKNQTSRARGAIIRAQKQADRFITAQRSAQSSSPSRSPQRSINVYRMPQGRGLSMPPINRHNDTSSQSYYGSSSKKDLKLKPLINQRAWIPGGHPNSIGRNKMASVGRPLNLLYQTQMGGGQIQGGGGSSLGFQN